MKLLAFLCLLSTLAAADDVDDRLRAAASRLASEDAAERDAGERELLAAAPDGGARLARILPDLSRRDRTALEQAYLDNGLFYEEDKTKACRKLLKKISKTSVIEPGRKALIREALDMGGPAAGAIAAEVRAMRTVTVPVASCVYAPDEGVWITFRVKNTGNRAMWIHPDALRLTEKQFPFGLRGKKLPWFGRVSIADSFGADERTPEDVLVEALTDLERIAPRKSTELSTWHVKSSGVGVVVVKTYVTQFSEKQRLAKFSGVAIPIPVAFPKARPRARLARVAARTGAGFSTRVVPDGKSWALEVTALEDRDAPAPDESFDWKFDHFWWMAEGEDRSFLGCGALREKAVADPAWKKGDVRRFPLPGPLPEGTTRLWMGYDYLFLEESYVAEAVDVGK